MKVAAHGLGVAEMDGAGIDEAALLAHAYGAIRRLSSCAALLRAPQAVLT